MMEKTDETIPSREELAVFIEEAAVSVTNNYDEAPAVLMVDDAVIGTLGNFSASIGKAKSRDFPRLLKMRMVIYLNIYSLLMIWYMYRHRRRLIRGKS